jgi:propionate CoA-transferase
MIDHPALPFLKRDEKGKVVSAADAVKLIGDGDTLATGGGSLESALLRR